MTYDLQVGAIGAVITATLSEDGVGVDLTTATTVELILRGPKGPRVPKTATVIDAPAGIVRVITAAGDIDLHGTWKLQGRVVFDDGTEFASDVVSFEVGPNL